MTYNLHTGHEYNERASLIFRSLNAKVLFERSLERGNVWQTDKVTR